MYFTGTCHHLRTVDKYVTEYFHDSAAYVQAHWQKEWMAAQLAPHMSLALRERIKAAGPQGLSPVELRELSTKLGLNLQTVR